MLRTCTTQRERVILDNFAEILCFNIFSLRMYFSQIQIFLKREENEK